MLSALRWHRVQSRRLSPPFPAVFRFYRRPQPASRRAHHLPSRRASRSRPGPGHRSGRIRKDSRFQDSRSHSGSERVGAGVRPSVSGVLMPATGSRSIAETFSSIRVGGHGRGREGGSRCHLDIMLAGFLCRCCLRCHVSGGYPGQRRSHGGSRRRLGSRVMAGRFTPRGELMMIVALGSGEDRGEDLSGGGVRSGGVGSGQSGFRDVVGEGGDGSREAIEVGVWV